MLILGEKMQNIKKVATEAAASNFKLQAFINQAQNRQDASAQARIDARNNNRLEKGKKSHDVATYNKTNTDFRTARAVNRSVRGAAETLDSANESINTVETNLLEIKSILETAMSGQSTNLDADQARINTLVNDIQSIATNTTYRDQALFAGDFDTEVLDSIDISSYNLTFDNQETGIIDPPELPEVVPSSVAGAQEILGDGNGFDNENVIDTINEALTLLGNGNGIEDQFTSLASIVPDPVNPVFQPTNPNYDQYDAFGSEVAMNDDYVVVGSPFDETSGIFGGSIYIFNRDDMTEVARIEGPNLGSQFGEMGSIAINDNNQIVVGSYSDVTRVYDASTGNLQFELSTDEADQTGFGSAVDINNDYIIVGRNNSSVTNGEEEVYVFDASTGNQLYKFDTNDGGDGNRYFYADSVALDGDTLLVGATGWSSNPEGSVFAYDLNSGSFKYRYTASDGAAFNYLGSSLDITTINSDGSGDKVGVVLSEGERAIYTFDLETGVELNKISGITNGGFYFSGNENGVEVYDRYAVVGASHSGTTSGGAAFVFDILTGNEIDFLEPAVPAEGFGTSVTFDDKGLIIGAPDDNQIYSYQVNSNYSTVANPDLYGSEVKVTAAYIASAAYGDDLGGNNSGAIYLNDKSGNLLRTIDTSALSTFDIENNVLAAASNTSNSIEVFNAGNGNLDRTINTGLTGVQDLVVSGAQIYAFGDAGGGNFNVEVYNADTGTFLNSFAVDGDNEIAVDGNNLIVADSDGDSKIYNVDFGNLVSTLDMDSNRADKVAIDGGFALATDTTANAGNGEVKVFNTNTGLELFTLNADVGGNIAFGSSVDVFGNYAVVGAKDENDVGAAYVFDLRDGSQVDKLTSTDTIIPGSDFGASVAIDGTDIVIGDPTGQDTNSLEAAGNVKVFNINETTSSVANPDLFGAKVRLTDTYIATAAPGTDINGENSGVIHIDDFNGTEISTIYSNLGLGPNSEINFDVSGDKVAISNTVSNTVEIFSAFTGNFTTSFSTGLDTINDIATTDTHTVVKGTSSGQGLVEIYNNTGTLIRQITGLNAQTQNEIDVDGSNIIVAGENGTDTQVFDLTTGTLISSMSMGGFSNINVALEGNYALVSDLNANVGQGEVKLFEVSTGNEVLTLNPGLLSNGDIFGSSLDISGDFAVVGAANYGASNIGSSFVFDLRDGSLVDQLSSTNAATNGEFGSSVAIQGNRIAVSEPGGIDPNTSEAAGRVQLFDLTPGDPANVLLPGPTGSVITGNGIEIDISSQEAGTLGAGTYSALSDISISENIASVGGITGTVVNTNIYDIEQMLENLNGFKTTLSNEVYLFDDKESISKYVQNTTANAMEVAAEQVFMADSDIVLNLLP